MKRIIFFLLISFLLASYSYANNLQIGAISKVDNTHLQFSIQWDNSWKVTGGPANWDAVWIFIKYQDCATNYLPWQHVGLSTTSSDHTVTGGVLQIDAVPDGKGVFIHRSAAGSGNISSATVTLKMTMTDNSYNYQLNGIEMVYIPQGAFYAGDGNRGAGNQYGFTGNSALSPLLIDNTVQSNGLTASQYLVNTGWGSSAALPSTFPMGYNAYYCMKYEISQEAYAAFLNTLTYDQQLTRFSNAPNSATGTFVMAGLPNPQNCRNGLRIKTSGQVSNIPAIVGCDLNLNGTFDEADDGQNVACNWLSWSDLMAFLDWAALRPMTEFEFEKACRGSASPVAGEYAWGTTTLLAANSGAIAYPGATNEISITTGAGLCAHNVNSYTSRGPLRCGFAASLTSTRTVAGATFYGVMEMSGNVSEQCLGGYSYNYSSFTTQNGDGNLTSTGIADTPNWPLVGGGNAGGGTCRGGNWYDNSSNLGQVSNRDWMTWNGNQSKDSRVGGRGVRTF
ncbi:MAG: SUMF1/EgtB/PvdO family nonheme iron enzyme [Bacteroidota bacterium]|nr:SUMF1/EgtB/PvdO family nonheme iron enzyme [Bacteroidota bacterium]